MAYGAQSRPYEITSSFRIRIVANLPSLQNDNLWLVHFLKLVVRYRSKNYPSDNRVDVNHVSDNRRQETQCVNGLARSDNGCKVAVRVDHVPCRSPYHNRVDRTYEFLTFHKKVTSIRYTIELSFIPL